MVTTGGIPSDSAFTRVSSVLSSNILLAGLRRNQGELARLQEQLSTGLRIIRPSDDAIGANRVFDFSRGLSRNEQFVRNVETASSRIAFADSSLDQANEIVNRARDIMLAQGQSTATAQTRLLAAQEVNELLRQAVNLGNTRLEGRYLFGGSRTGEPPFAQIGRDVAFRGDLAALQADVADGLRAQTNITAAAFGAVTSEIRSIALGGVPPTHLPLDLNPTLTGPTRLAVLNGGRGVAAGSIQIGVGASSAIVDLRTAENVGDVIARINAVTATTGVTAAIGPADDGIRLTSGGPPITVQEVGGGRTAADLGILVTGAATPFDGADLDPLVTKDTFVSQLRGGAGLAANGIIVRNDSATQSLVGTFGATVFAAGNRIEQVLNAINGEGIGVEARINADGTNIEIVSRLSGARLTILENGGATAAQMGLLSTARRARLVDLNGGNGLGTVGGNDLVITKKNGQQLFFDVDTFATVHDFLLAVEADPQLTATINAGNQIVITDSSGGAGPLQIANLNGSFAAINLGIAASTAGVTITGSAITFVGVQPEGLFTALIRLRDALEDNDGQRILGSGRLLDAAQDLILTARADTGARLSSLELTLNRLDQERVELERLRSSTRDLDFAEAATRFRIQQTVLEASLATASRILQTSLFSFLE